MDGKSGEGSERLPTIVIPGQSSGPRVFRAVDASTSDLKMSVSALYKHVAFLQFRARLE
jgi:hypothetical protein